ncbi:hypothetical protein FOL47_009573 [Perkinsus chesapeaki]|uniref:Mitochondrial inner membrane protease subunit n=1 Tax=Perkinsus chesapeaki TaxID=330153 RepID=A0A7J6L7E1_PERCH|nr:hypothetical protein FOL47_009573 [Perkinsus chesapeaki]
MYGGGSSSSSAAGSFLYRFARKTATAIWMFGPPLVWVKDRIVDIEIVQGHSMSPTLNPYTSGIKGWFRDRILVLRNLAIGPGDVVTFYDPFNPKRHLVKRVVGIQPKRRSSSIYSVDDYDELGGASGIDETTQRVAFEDIGGRVYVLGDNPKRSVDSRTFGPIPQPLIDGLVVGVIWPPWRLSWVPRPPDEDDEDDYDDNAQ